MAAEKVKNPEIYSWGNFFNKVYYICRINMPNAISFGCDRFR